MVAVAALVASSLSANAGDNRGGVYIEGNLGLAQLGEMSTSTSGAGTIDRYDYNGMFALDFEFDHALAYGAEVGIGAIGGSGLRLGLSVTQFESDLDTVTLTYSGTVTDTSTGETLTGTASGSGSADGDLEVSLFGLNGYYDFDTGGGFTPFIGVGVGLADIGDADDNEFAFSAHAGGQYALGDGGAYIGLKGSYYKINGPTVVDVVTFDDMNAFLVLATLGFRF